MISKADPREGSCHLSAGAEAALLAACLVRVHGPDPKGRKVRSHSFYKLHDGTASFSSSGLLLPERVVRQWSEGGRNGCLLQDAHFNGRAALELEDDEEERSPAAVVLTSASVVSSFVKQRGGHPAAFESNQQLLLPGTHIEVVIEPPCEETREPSPPTAHRGPISLPATLLCLLPLPDASHFSQQVETSFGGISSASGQEASQNSLAAHLALLRLQALPPSQRSHAFRPEPEAAATAAAEVGRGPQTSSLHPIGCQQLSRTLAAQRRSKLLQELPPLHRGQPLVAAGSPFGVLSSRHFLNSVVQGTVANYVMPAGSRPASHPSLLLLDMCSSPGMEGAPLCSQSGGLVGLLLPLMPLVPNDSAMLLQTAVTVPAIIAALMSSPLHLGTKTGIPGKLAHAALAASSSGAATAAVGSGHGSGGVTAAAAATATAAATRSEVSQCRQPPLSSLPSSPKPSPLGSPCPSRSSTVSLSPSSFLLAPHRTITSSTSPSASTTPSPSPPPLPPTSPSLLPALAAVVLVEVGGAAWASGVVIHARGIVLTNAHVVRGRGSQQQLQQQQQPAIRVRLDSHHSPDCTMLTQDLGPPKEATATASAYLPPAVEMAAAAEAAEHAPVSCPCLNPSTPSSVPLLFSSRWLPADVIFTSQGPLDIALLQVRLSLPQTASRTRAPSAASPSFPTPSYQPTLTAIVPAPSLPPLGSPAFVVGHGLFPPPLGLSASLTAGIVTKLVAASSLEQQLLPSPTPAASSGISTEWSSSCPAPSSTATPCHVESIAARKDDASTRVQRLSATFESCPAMMQTTASVHGGASGGAVVDEEGRLIALVTSNARHLQKKILPHLNFCIPLPLLAPALCFAATGDESVLSWYNNENQDLKTVWDLGSPEAPRVVPKLPRLFQDIMQRVKHDPDTRGGEAAVNRNLSKL